METNTATRRAMLGTLALAVPVAMTASTAALAAPAAAVDRSEWDRAFAIMERARADDDAANAIYMRAYAAFLADIPPIEEQAFRHSDAFHANDIDAYEANWLSQRDVTWSGDHFEQAGLREIADVREWRRLRDASERRHNFAAVEAEWERVGDILYEARWTLFALPAPNTAALLWKSEHLFGDSTSGTAWNPNILASYVADARRLLGGKA